MPGRFLAFMPHIESREGRNTFLAIVNETPNGFAVPRVHDDVAKESGNRVRASLAVEAQ